MAGWIKISRDLVGHWLWQDAERLKWWLDLLFMAAWDDRKQIVGKQLVILKKGQLIASLSFLCGRWERSRTMVEPYLDLLIDEGMIEKNVSHNVSIITICNFEKYQTNNSTYLETPENTNGYAPFDDSQNAPLEAHPDTYPDAPLEAHPDAINKELIINKEDNINESPKGDLSVCDAQPMQQEAVDYRRFVDFFNETTNGCFGKLRHPLGEGRKKHIRARVAQFGKKALEEVVKKAAASDFLRGSSQSGFVATFDWIIRPNNFEKILSGNYDNKEGQARTSSGRDMIGTNFNDKD